MSWYSLTSHVYVRRAARGGNYELNHHLGSILVVVVTVLQWPHVNCMWEKGWVEAFQLFAWELRSTGIEVLIVKVPCRISRRPGLWPKYHCALYDHKARVQKARDCERAMIPRDSSRWGVSVQPPPVHTHMQTLYTCALTHGWMPSHEELEWVGTLSFRAADLVCVQMALDVF